MSCIVVMTRTNQTQALYMRKEYLCPIPLNIIKEIATIEKKEWRKFCFAPYYGLSKFIASHLDTYHILKPYISLKTRAFDFTYQYVCDCSMPLASSYILNKVSISASEYGSYTDDYYLEQWTIFNSVTTEALTFFEFEHIPPDTVNYI